MLVDIWVPPLFAVESVQERPAELRAVHEVEDEIGRGVDADEEVRDLDDVLDH